jgi:hypothetical protein
MSVQTIYLGFVLVAFALFIVTLGFVSIWSRGEARRRSAAEEQPRPAPRRHAGRAPAPAAH